MLRLSHKWRARVTLAVASALVILAVGGILVARRTVARHRARPTKPMIHANRLINEKSPYLQQHAHNPVDWYPWGEEAFEKARREDKPIFLSVGYSTCHWCHVMERESFENDEIARLINDSFIPIKVDREERPDIDQVYLDAVQAMTGRGGWPMSVFIMPDGRPFSGGTYFPPEQFKQVLARVARMYRNDRAKVEAAAVAVAESVATMVATPKHPAESEPMERLVRRTLEVLHRNFDAEHGGFGGAPKFPPHGAIALLLHEHGRTADKGLLRMVTATLDQMALGGIHDHIGGGFHRYSTDERWFLPHFEKMLYDNALMLRNYAEAYSLTGDPLYRQVADGICTWIGREMTSPEGAFYSALDADSEGVEGRYYVWPRAEIIRTLGEEEGRLFCTIYGIEENGNYRDEGSGRRAGDNIPYLRQCLSAAAKARGLSPSDLESRLADAREELLAARERRPRPQRDDKIIASWNGLMIASLAYAGRALSEPRYTEMAQGAARFVLDNLYVNKRLLRRWREGEAKHPGCLDDYAYLVYGLLELHQTTRDGYWLDRARDLTDTAITEFWDERAGGFFYTASEAERLFVRPKDALDHPLPSGNGMAALALLRLGELTGEQRYLAYADRTLRAMAPWMERAPHGTETLALATAVYLERRSRPTTAGLPAIERQQLSVTVDRHPVKVTARVADASVAPGEEFEVKLALEIAEGWHINSHRPRQDYLIPTAVTLEGDLPVEVGKIQYPAGRDAEVGGDTLSVYHRRVNLVVPLRVKDDARRGRGELCLCLGCQACDSAACRPPDQLRLRLPLTIGPKQ